MVSEVCKPLEAAGRDFGEKGLASPWKPRVLSEFKCRFIVLCPESLGLLGLGVWSLGFRV